MERGWKELGEPCLCSSAVQASLNVAEGGGLGCWGGVVGVGRTVFKSRA